MVTLEFTLESQTFEANAKRVEGSLKGIDTAAKQTQGSVTNVGASLSRSFQATQGGVQIATGIAQTATAFQSLNLAAAGFVGARTLLEIGQTASQMAVLRGGTGAAATAFTALGRAIPYVGLALSAAAAGMAVFGNETKKTANSFEELVAAMEKTRIQQNVAARLGVPGGGFDRNIELRRLFSAAEYIDTADVFASGGAGRGFSIADLQELLGDRSRAELTTELLQYPGLSAQNRWQIEGYNSGAVRDIGGAGFGGVQLSREEAFGFVRSRYNRMSIDPTTGAPYGAGNYDVPISPELAEQSRQVEASMQRAAEYAGQIGAALGAGVFDVLAGIQSWRQALADLVGSTARQSLANLGSSFASNLFSPTARQSNPNPVGGGAYQ